MRRAPVKCRSRYVLYRLVWMGARRPRSLIRTRDDLLELIAHALRLQLSYLSKEQALAGSRHHPAHPQGRAVIDPPAHIMPATRGSGVMAKPQTVPPMAPQPAR